MRKQQKTIWPALALLITWLIVAGGLTWQRSREALIPPVWDQKTYVQKADGFWDSVEKGERKNPLNIEPTVRPPGTILLTAPLGPLKDYRNFYFRSVMVPVVITVVAVFIAGVGSTGMAWQSAAVALLLGSMPMFWQFESQTIYLWGMVDTFLASVAALAMACLLIAAMRAKPIWTGPALIAIGLLPLIKPSGFIVDAMVGIAWMAIGFRSLRLHPRGPRRGWIELTVIGCIIAATVGIVALLSKGSAYFSPENMALGNEALAQLRKQSLGFRETFSYFGLIFTQGIGILPMVVIAAIGTRSVMQNIGKADKERNSDLAWPAKISIPITIASLILCYQGTLFMQMRYLFPFITITAILLVPSLVTWCSQAGKLGIGGTLLLPFGLLVFLSTPSFSKVAEQIGGYGLYSGYGQTEIEIADKLAKELSAENKTIPILYHSAGVYNRGDKKKYKSEYFNLMAFIAGYSKALQEIGYNDNEISQSIKTSMSWEKDTVIEISSMYNADILALETSELKNQGSRSHQTLNFTDEQIAWISWLLSTPSSGSTAVAMRTPELTVLVIKNRALLEQQMRTYIASRSWRQEFLAANQPKNFAKDQLNRQKLNGIIVQEPISFESRLKVYALNFSHNNKTNQVKTIIYSERLPLGKLDNPKLFIHELDKENNVLAMHEVPLSASRFPDRPISLDQSTFQPMAKTQLLGVGIYEPRMGSLKSNWAHAKDWGGRRAKLKLVDLPSEQNSTR